MVIGRSPGSGRQKRVSDRPGPCPRPKGVRPKRWADLDEGAQPRHSSEGVSTRGLGRPRVAKRSPERIECIPGDGEAAPERSIGATPAHLLASKTQSFESQSLLLRRVLLGLPLSWTSTLRPRHIRQG